jgi:hypothetical protein
MCRSVEILQVLTCSTFWDPEWTELQVAKHLVHCYPIRVWLKSVLSIFGVAKLRHL